MRNALPIIQKVKLSSLKVNPLTIEIYGNEAAQKKDIDIMVASFLEVGQKTPLAVNGDMVIISGLIRYWAAKELGWDYILVIINPTSPNDNLSVIHSNKGREKTAIQKRNEIVKLSELIPKAQGKSNRIMPGTGEPIKGKRTEIIGALTGTSASTVNKILDIVEEEKKNPALAALGVAAAVIEGKIKPDAGIKMQKKFTAEEEQKAKDLKGPKPRLFTDNIFIVHHKDCKDLSSLADSSVPLFLQSIPFWELRPEYIKGNKTELGKEATPEEFAENAAAHFDLCKKKLKPKGSVVIEIGDTIKNGQMCDIPELFSAAMKSRGWKKVQNITWYANRLPNNKGANGEIRRLQNNTSMIFHFVLDTNYDYYPFRVYTSDEPRSMTAKPQCLNLDGTTTGKGKILTPDGNKYKNFLTVEDGEEALTVFLNRCEGVNVIKGANGGKRTKDLKEINPDIKHIAPMASYVPVIPILELTKPGDLVVDLFSGSGTTGIIATSLGRLYQGWEINKKYVQLSLENYSKLQQLKNTKIIELNTYPGIAA